MKRMSSSFDKIPFIQEERNGAVSFLRNVTAYGVVEVVETLNSSSIIESLSLSAVAVVLVESSWHPVCTNDSNLLR
jgi:hypothetical protein